MGENFRFYSQLLLFKYYTTLNAAYLWACQKKYNKMTIEEVYDIPLNQKKMGLKLEAPRIFNINHKLTLNNPYSLIIGGEKVTKSIEKWINEAPELIWAVLYNNTVPVEVNIIRKLSLARDSFNKLKATIQALKPGLIHELVQKKKARTKA